MIPDWQTATITLSVIGILGAAVAYMVAKISGSKSIYNFSKKELLEAVFNIFAAVLFLLVLNFIDFTILRPYAAQTLMPAIDPQLSSLAGQIKGGTGSGTALPSLPYMAAVVAISTYNCVNTMVGFLIPINALMMSHTKGMNAGVKGVYIPLGLDVDLYTAAFRNAFDLTLFVVVVGALFVKVLMFSATLAPLLIMFGFPMRALAPLRGAGGYLIAFGISFFLVLPFSYLVLMASSWSPHVCSLTISKSMLNMKSTSNVFYASWVFLKYMAVHMTRILKELDLYTVNIINNFCIIPIVALAFAFTSTNMGSTLFGARLSEIGRGLVKFI